MQKYKALNKVWLCLGLLLLVVMLAPQTGMATEAQEEGRIIKPFMAASWSASAEEILAAENGKSLKDAVYQKEVLGYGLTVSYLYSSGKHINSTFEPLFMTSADMETLRQKLTGHITSQMHNPRRLENIRSRQSNDENKPGEIVFKQDFIMDQHTLVYVSYQWREYDNKLEVKVDLYENDPQVQKGGDYFHIKRKFDNANSPAGETAASPQAFPVDFSWNAKIKDIKKSQGKPAGSFWFFNYAVLTYEKDFLNMTVNVEYTFEKDGFWGYNKLDCIMPKGIILDADDITQALEKIDLVNASVALNMNDALILQGTRNGDYDPKSYTSGETFRYHICNADTYGAIHYRWNEEFQYVVSTISIFKRVYLPGATQKFPFPENENIPQAGQIKPFMPLPWGSDLENSTHTIIYYKIKVMGYDAIVGLYSQWREESDKTVLNEVHADFVELKVTKDEAAALRAELAGQMHTPEHVGRENYRKSYEFDRPGNVQIYWDYLQDDITSAEIAYVWYEQSNQLKIRVDLYDGTNRDIAKVVKNAAQAGALQTTGIVFQSPFLWGPPRQDIVDHEGAERAGQSISYDKKVFNVDGKVTYSFANGELYFYEESFELGGVNWESVPQFMEAVLRPKKDLGVEMYHSTRFLYISNNGLTSRSDFWSFLDGGDLYDFTFVQKEYSGSFIVKLAVFDAASVEGRKRIAELRQSDTRVAVNNN